MIDSIAKISGCDLKQPPGVAVSPVATLVNPIVENIQVAPQHVGNGHINVHDVGKSQENQLCADGDDIKPRTRGKNIHQNCQHQHARAQSIAAVFQRDKAKFENCTIASLLTNRELDAMKNQGAVVIHLGMPHKSTMNKERAIFWTIINVSSEGDIFTSPFKGNLLIVTTYDQVMTSKHICFIGTVSQKPTPKTWVLSCLVH